MRLPAQKSPRRPPRIIIGVPAKGLADEVNEQNRLATQNAQSAIAHAIRCGEILIEQKSNLVHGEWKQWVEMYCEFGLRSAQVYMRVAQQKRSALRFSSLRNLISDDRLTREKSAKTETVDTETEEYLDVEAPAERRAGSSQEKTSPARSAKHESRGVALAFSMKAIDLLGQIPVNDALRDQALDDVIQWIKHNR